MPCKESSEDFSKSLHLALKGLERGGWTTFRELFGSCAPAE